MCKSLGCTKEAINNSCCFDCQEIKVEKRRGVEKSGKSHSRQIRPDLTEFGSSLISVSKGNKTFLLSDTYLFIDMECDSIN